ncbi:MAG: hypothetical protein P8Y98_03510 [Anaerolineales bacterium]|jgi:hypothetical protein
MAFGMAAVGDTCVVRMDVGVAVGMTLDSGVNVGLGVIDTAQAPSIMVHAT